MAFFDFLGCSGIIRHRRLSLDRKVMAEKLQLGKTTKMYAAIVKIELEVAAIDG